jgi:protein-S-isoprenylcysteine O-methyltransferase Ste14
MVEQSILGIVRTAILRDLHHCVFRCRTVSLVPHLPLVVYVISYIAFIFSIYLYSWAMWVNTWFSSTVRIQTDRAQEVVQDGPYRYVRHPGYVAGILMAISTSLILGSLWGLIPAVFVVILLVIRTYLEDITLQKELPGYFDYVKKVRYRLVPGL